MHSGGPQTDHFYTELPGRLEQEDTSVETNCENTRRNGLGKYVNVNVRLVKGYHEGYSRDPTEGQESHSVSSHSILWTPLRVDVRNFKSMLLHCITRPLQ